MAPDPSTFTNPVGPDDFYTIVSQIFRAYGFPVDAWEPKGFAVSLARVLANLASTASFDVAALFRASLLDYSTTSDGTTQWIASDKYGETLPAPTQTVGTVILRNQSGSLQTFAAGTYVVNSPSTGNVFSNVSAVNVESGGTTNVVLQSQATGTSTAVSFETLLPANTLAGTLTISGSPGISWITSAGTESWSEGVIKQRCRSKWDSFTPAGLGGAYYYWSTQNAAVTRVRVNRMADVLGGAYNPQTDANLQIVLAGSNGPLSSAIVASVGTLLQGTVAPMDVSLSTISAVGAPYRITGTFVCKTGQATTVQAAVTSNLVNLFGKADIGGALSDADVIAALQGGSAASGPGGIDFLPVHGVTDKQVSVNGRQLRLGSANVPPAPSLSTVWQLDLAGLTFV